MGVQHQIEALGTPLKIGGQHFDRRRCGGGAQGIDAGGKLGGPPVEKIIAIDRGDDDMFQSQYQCPGS
ncbi:MAG: hypothetical protein HW380_2670 [Magnetococcales bacterium]|nr:hypothetical protein [Magnetococcales bacterium]